MLGKVAWPTAIAMTLVLTLALVLSQPPAQPQERVPGAYKALSFWTAQRAYPLDDIPDRASFAAFEHAKRLKASHGGDRSTQVAPWTSLGPHNVGGRTLAVAISPEDPDVVWAGSASGGLWRSTTGGIGAAAWQQVPTGFPLLAVSSIAISPTDADTLFIGTGEVYNYQNAEIFGEPFRSMRGSYGIGILKSSDGGASWAASLDWSSAQRRGVQAVRLDPSNPATVWAATTEGVHKSTDGGASWLLSLDVIMATDLVIDPSNGDKLVVGCGNFSSLGKGLYRTDDGGATWIHEWTGVNPPFIGKIQLGISQSSPNIVFASIGSGFSGGADEFTWLLRSNDGGDTWFVVSIENYATYQGWFSHDVAVHPSDPDEVFAVGFEVWRSTQGGTNLVQKASFNPYTGEIPPGEPEGPPDYVHADVHQVVYHPTDPQILYFATDGGVFRTTDGGETYEGCNGGYQTSQFYAGFSTSATDPHMAMGGLQDNSTTIYRGSTTWAKWVLGGDGSWTAIDPGSSSTVYGSSQYMRLYKSYDGGYTWDPITPNMGTNRPTCFIAPFVLAADDTDVIYAGRDVVYKSTDGGLSWSYTNGGLALDGNPLLTMAVSRQTSDVLYVASAPDVTRSGVFRTLDGGDTWTDITGGVPDRFPGDLAVDPGDDSVVFVTLSGFGSSHVFRSVNGGDSWQDIGAGLPDVPTSAVVVDPSSSNHLYVGTDIGIFVSIDGGASWTDFNEGITEVVAVLDLVVTPGRKLRMATHGNGVFERDLVFGHLFSDGFESGDTLRWAVTTP